MANDLVKIAHYGKAEIFYTQGHLEKAKVEVEKALTFDPNYQDAQQLLKAIKKQKNRVWWYCAWASIVIIAIFLIFKGVIFNGGDETAKKPPSIKVDHAKIGYDHLEKGEYNEAIAALKEAISINPNNEVAYNNLGIAYYDTEQYEDAITAFKESVSLNPNDVGVHNGLGLSYYNIEKYDDAITAFREAVSLNPEIKYLHNNLGWAYFKIKQFSDAKKAVEKALEIDPNYESANRLLAAITKELEPKLLIERLSLIEPSGEGFLDADETAEIKFTVKNGGGTVSDISVWIKWDSIDGLSYKPQIISTLDQNRSKTIRIPITASRTIKGKKNLKMKIQLVQKDGTVLASKTFSITTRPSLPGPVR